MVVHLVIEPGIAGTVRPGHGANVQGLSIGKNNALPGHQDAALTVGDRTRITAHQTRALGNQAPFAGGRVEYVLTDLRHDLAGQLGVDAGNQGGGHHKAGAQLIGRTRGLRAGVESPAVALRRAGKLGNFVTACARL